MRKIFVPLSEALSALENTATCLLLLTVIVLSCLQIVLRDVFQHGLPWIDPLVRYLVVWTGMAGAVIAAREGHHISIDLVFRNLSGTSGRLLAGGLSCTAACVCGVLAWAGLRFIVDERAYGSSELLGYGSWLWLSVLPAGFFLIACRFMARGIGFFTGKTVTPGSKMTEDTP